MRLSGMHDAAMRSALPNMFMATVPAIRANRPECVKRCFLILILGNSAHRMISADTSPRSTARRVNCAGMSRAASASSTRGDGMRCAPIRDLSATLAYCKQLVANDSSAQSCGRSVPQVERRFLADSCQSVCKRRECCASGNPQLPSNPARPQRPVPELRGHSVQQLQTKKGDRPIRSFMASGTEGQRPRNTDHRSRIDIEFRACGGSTAVWARCRLGTQRTSPVGRRSPRL
jgi:hypothetical protein